MFLILLKRMSWDLIWENNMMMMKKKEKFFVKMKIMIQINKNKIKSRKWILNEFELLHKYSYN